MLANVKRICYTDGEGRAFALPFPSGLPLCQLCDQLNDLGNQLQQRRCDRRLEGSFAAALFVFSFFPHVRGAYGEGLPLKQLDLPGNPPVGYAASPLSTRGPRLGTGHAGFLFRKDFVPCFSFRRLLAALKKGVNLLNFGNVSSRIPPRLVAL